MWCYFLGEIGNLKYEKVTEIFKESYTHHEEKFITLTLYPNGAYNRDGKMGTPPPEKRYF